MRKTYNLTDKFMSPRRNNTPAQLLAKHKAGLDQDRSTLELGRESLLISENSAFNKNTRQTDQVVSGNGSSPHKL
jgi:hypothetical protein